MMTFSGSALLSKNIEHVPSETAQHILKQVLTLYSESPEQEWIDFLSQNLRNIELSKIQSAIKESEQVRNGNTIESSALADFLVFQAVAFLPKNVFQNNHDCPSNIDLFYKWGASSLHTYGLKQAKYLASVAAQICKWCINQQINSIHIIDSPLGGTLPAQVLKTALQQSGIKVQVHEFLAPRLDKHGEKYSIRAAAKSFCETFNGNTDFVIFPDEVITGTRIIKLFSALWKHLGTRLIPVVLHVRNHTKPALRNDQIKRIQDKLKNPLIDGIPTYTIFPEAILMKIDDGYPMTASSPIYWAEIDLSAGKRKVNFIFGLINEFRCIANLLSTQNHQILSILYLLMKDSTADEVWIYVKELMSKFTALIDWDNIEEKAKIEFPNEYKGIIPKINDEWINERYKWVLDSIYSQLFQHSSKKEIPNEAGVVVNVLEYLYDPNKSAELPPNRDFCEYTIPYAFPIKAFHEELVQLVLNEMSSLEQQQNPSQSRH